MTVVLINPYVAAAHSYKGQLHCHSDASFDVSAPNNSPTELLTAYKNAGYDFVGLTDHDVLTAQLNIAGLLHIPSVEETTPPEAVHLGRIGATAVGSPGAVQTVINASIAEGGIPILNHPNRAATPWTYAKLALVSGYLGLEVFNQIVERLNATGNAEDIWDALLSAGQRLFGVAVDDSHDVVGLDFNKAWVVVSADSLTQAAVIAAIKAANFYFTTGPTLTISVSGVTVTASTPAASTIAFLGNGGATLQTTPNATTAAYTAVGNERYIRVRITRDSDSLKAWSNPVYVENHYSGAPLALPDDPYVVLDLQFRRDQSAAAVVDRSVYGGPTPTVGGTDARQVYWTKQGFRFEQADFAATNDGYGYLDFGDVLRCNLAQALTLEVFVKPEIKLAPNPVPTGWTSGGTNAEMLLSKHGTVTDSQYFLSLPQANSRPRFALVNSTPTRVIVDAPATITSYDGHWHHVVGTYDGATMRLYYDGVQVSTGAQTGTINTTTRKVRVGNADFATPTDSNGFNFRGLMALARVYSRVLPPQEIAARYRMLKREYC